MSGSLANEASAGWRRPVGTFLFMAVFLFLYIGLNPFVDLTGAAVLDPSAGNSNRLNQIVSLLLFGAILGYGLTHPMRGIILRPRLLLGTLFGWFLAVSLVSAHPVLGIKGVVLAAMATAQASIYLLLPASERHFAKMLGIGTLIVLAIAYFGVIFLPQFSIHQASELREPMNAGLWRGHFPHKNSAAAAMVLAAFFGLYAMRAWSRAAGLAIFALACLFLVHTGGKTSSAMLPGILLLAFFFEKMPFFLRPLIVIGGVLLFNFVAVGAAVIAPLGELVASMGVDATFTNRADIWRFAFSAIAERPWTGHGFRAFWQTAELVHGGGLVETWAVAAENGHNSYLDITLTTGLVGLLLTVIWLLVLPLRHVARIPQADRNSPLTRLFVRIWLYAIFNAGLESLFFEGGNLLWFSLVFSLYGLRLQSAARLAPSPRAAPGGRIVAHA